MGTASLIEQRAHQRPAKMPNLKLIAMRLKSVTNIQKITMSMKMVSAAKYARAERDLKAARPLGEAASVFYDQAEVSCEKEQPKNLYVAITSDRGLAGGVHSSICRCGERNLEQWSGVRPGQDDVQ